MQSVAVRALWDLKESAAAAPVVKSLLLAVLLTSHPRLPLACYCCTIFNCLPKLMRLTESLTD